jgi:hypothetical protein
MGGGGGPGGPGGGDDGDDDQDWGSDDDNKGCKAQANQETCDAFAGEITDIGGGDPDMENKEGDDDKPKCMWRSTTDSKCEPFDQCTHNSLFPYFLIPLPCKTKWALLTVCCSGAAVVS